MNLSKREYIALELLKKLAKNEDGQAVSKAYAMADDFIAESNTCEDDAKNYGINSESTLDPIFGLDIRLLEFNYELQKALEDSEVENIGQLVRFTQHHNYKYFTNKYSGLAEISNTLTSLAPCVRIVVTPK